MLVKFIDVVGLGPSEWEVSGMNCIGGAYTFHDYMGLMKSGTYA